MRHHVHRPVTRTALALSSSVALVLGCTAATMSSTYATGARAARTYVVNSTADTVDADVGVAACADAHKKCSLRAAIMQANFHPGADIVVLPAGRFTLTRKGNNDDADVVGDLDVTGSITLVGAGQGKTVIDGNGVKTGDRVLQVVPPVGTPTDTTIRDLTIRGGKRSGVFDLGGGLLYQAPNAGGNLTLKNVTLSHNSSYDGGGLVASSSPTGGDHITLDHVTVAHNSATAAVGGIDATIGEFATFVIRNSVVHANKAFEAAGLYLESQSPTSDSTSFHVESTVLSNNKSIGIGGGLEVRAGTKNAPVLVDTSYFHRNTGGSAGGAISNFGVLYVRRSTLQGNTTPFNGGGIYDFEPALATFFNSTLSHNTAAGLGGGAFVEFFLHGGAEVRFVNSTLSDNSAPTGGGMYAQAGAVDAATNTLFSHGASGANCVGNIGGQTSLSDDNSCGFGGGDDNVDLKLGPLGRHGGPTLTMVPQTGSPAVNTGTLAGEPVIDQRGVARPQGSGQDIGAVEVCPLVPAQPQALKAHRLDHGRRLALRWKEAGCFETFTVVVRAGSQHGRVVETAKRLGSPRLVTKKLTKGRTYFWQVSVVGDRGTVPSAYHHVRLR